MSYNDLSRSQLTNLLKKRKLMGTGVRSLAITRLENYDQRQGNVFTKREGEVYSPKMTISNATVKYIDSTRPFYGVPINIVTFNLFPYLDNESLWALAQTCKSFYVPGSKLYCERFRLLLVKQHSLAESPLLVQESKMSILTKGRGITPAAAVYGFSVNCKFKRARAHRKGPKLYGEVSNAKLYEIIKHIQRCGTFENGMHQMLEQAQEMKQIEDARLIHESEMKQRTLVLNEVIKLVGCDFIYPFVYTRFRQFGPIVDFTKVWANFASDGETRTPDEIESIKASQKILSDYVDQGVEFNWQELWYHLAVLSAAYIFCTEAMWKIHLRHGMQRGYQMSLPSLSSPPSSSRFGLPNADHLSLAGFLWAIRLKLRGSLELETTSIPQAILKRPPALDLAIFDEPPNKSNKKE